jgi:hypothetical protein
MMAMRIAIVAALGVSLGACSEVREVPVTDLRPFKPISSSCVDTAETRKEIRAHNSVLESLKTGRKVVYSDPCPTEKPTS